MTRLQHDRDAAVWRGKNRSLPASRRRKAEGGHNQLSEKKRAIVALTQILGSGSLDEESLQLLEQLANCIQRPQTEIVRSAESAKQVAAQQVTTAEEESAETEPAEVSTGELSSSGEPEHNTEEGVIVGSLRTVPTDRWTCKVPSCTGRFHRLKDCRHFHKMEPEERLRLADYTVFAWGV